MMDQSTRLYIEEAKELLDQLEQALLALDSDPADMEQVASCFRAMHTIKGGGAMFGFDEISRFTHDVETVFDRVRNGAIPVTKDLLTLTLSAKDHIVALLENPEGGHDPALKEASDELIAKFRVFLPQDATSGAAPPGMPPERAQAAPAAPGAELPQDGAGHIFWVRFKPSPRILFTGNDPVRLLAELGTLGIMRAVRHGPLPELDDPSLEPEIVSGAVDILLHTPRDENAIRDVFIFVEDECSLEVVELGAGKLRASDLENLLSLLSGREEEDTAVLAASLRQALALLLDHIEETKATFRAKVPRKEHEPSGQSTLRVDAARLDDMVTNVGELVILQSRLRQAVKAGDLAAAAAVDEDLERLTEEMRDLALGLRMVPIGSVFNVFQRLVRDLSGTLGKEADFVTRGGETELDKTVIDRLKDPLIHILRNCLDHGIETPQDREAAGKPRRGEILLSASHSGGNVILAVSDNGRGIDTEAVRRKAVERGLLGPDDSPSEKDLFALIFEPGFSTAARVSDVSGRGVGMDVVKRNIENLRGSVEIGSVMSQGTTLVIRLPLTLAIIDGFNVVAGKESFIVPLTNLRGFQERFVTAEARKVETIEHMGHMIPLISLRRLFDIPGEQPDYERVVITEVEGARVGLSVDQVVGRQQAVIKSLDESCRHIKWISGSTINGDGSISLILDVPQLVHFARGTYGIDA